mmetsp:Transcript_48723/g.123577  ORF Transcript_48723/g.123577 Transcript_48723/m.123577 type:complete len:262 (+) Transcript_48723:906-1691(+)
MWLRDGEARPLLPKDDLLHNNILPGVLPERGNGRHGNGHAATQSVPHADGKCAGKLLVREVLVPQIEVFRLHAAWERHLALVLELLGHSHASHAVQAGQDAGSANLLRQLRAHVFTLSFDVHELRQHVRQRHAHVQEERSVRVGPPRRRSPILPKQRDLGIRHQRHQVLARLLGQLHVALRAIFEQAHAQLVVVLGQDVLGVQPVELFGGILPGHHAKHRQAAGMQLRERGHIVDVPVDRDHHLVGRGAVVFGKTRAHMRC